MFDSDELILTKSPPGGRGCGKRKAGGVYACCGFSPLGSPWYHFMVDPPTPYFGEQFRGIQLAEEVCPGLIPDDWPEDQVLLVDYVGREFYPSVPSFIEEERRYGLSRNWSGFDFTKLKGRKPYLALIHRWATVRLDGESPDLKLWPCEWYRGVKDHDTEEDRAMLQAHYPFCVYHTWPLSPAFHEIEEERGADVIRQPWGFFRPLAVVGESMGLDALDVFEAYEQFTLTSGVFAIFPISHVETIGKAVGSNVEESGLIIAEVKE